MTDWVIAGLVIVSAIAIAFALPLKSLVRLGVVVIGVCLGFGATQIGLIRGGNDPAANEPSPASEVEDITETASGQRQVRVGPRETRDIEFVVRLGGHQFVVPANILDTILIESREVEGELNQGFSMIALLPAFEGRTEANLQQFLVSSAQVNRARISVMRTCPPPPLPYECSVPVRASQALDSQWGDLIRADDIVPEVPGLVRFGKLVQPPPGAPGAPAGEVRSDVFDVEASAEKTGSKRVEFITCDAPGAVPVLHCHHLFAWRNDVWVQLTYKRENLPDWQDIQAGAVQTLSDFADAAPGAAETTIHFP